MAIFIKGKTTCRICGQVLTSSAVIVGVPNMKLPEGLEKLGDSCAHRACLDSHPRRDEIQLAWKQHWVAQAGRAPLQAAVNEHAVALFYPKRFVFAALDSFIDFEEAMESFDQLQGALGSSDGRERMSLAAAWNTYELDPTPSGSRLVIAANPAPENSRRSAEDSALLDYEFTSQRWAAFAQGWAGLKRG
jgi:hypothetical protein